jgi:hypothetical protein
LADVREFSQSDEFASVSLLLSEAVPAPFVDPRNPASKFDVALADSAKVRLANHGVL